MQPSPAPTAALAIEHLEGSTPAQFKLTRRSDGKSLASVTIPSPYEFPVQGHPQSHLMRELRWYLEDFLDYPFPPETTHAEHVLDALQNWGTQAFNALFDRGTAYSWLTSSAVIEVNSDDAKILSWPWEALFSPETGAFIAHQYRFERHLNRIKDPKPLAELPANRINILLVVARPYNDDVRYRSIARSLVELIQSKNLPAQVTVLRPPTFDNLRQHLEENPAHYHVLHFDGHGAFGNAGGEFSPNKYRAPQGCLVFEDTEGKPDEKSAADLSTLLRDHAVPAVVLNACQSATFDPNAPNPFTTVAAALLQSGMRSVVAMAYSLYVSGAQVFLPAFYRRLFEKGNIAEAVRAGRQQMLSQKKRGLTELQDWLLPVLYQQQPIDFTFAESQAPQQRTTRLPKEVLEARDEYGFIGRDGPILEMERALHRKAPSILVQGLGGVGKTTLSRGFLRWLDETGGLDACLWFDFRDIRTSQYVLTQKGQFFYGENFGVAKNKLELLRDAFQKYRAVIVWDNFESATQNLPNKDRSELVQFLQAIHGTLGKVIITSRSSEEWIAPSLRFELSLRGLDGDERWQYCDTILRELGLASKINSTDPELGLLMNQLAGHPLAMRVILPKLERMSAARIADALRNNIAELGLNENEEQGRVFATLQFVEQGLPEDLRPLMALVALHESYIDADYLEAMSKRVDTSWTRSLIDQLMSALCAAGLLKDLGQSIYEMHPLLTSYLRSRHVSSSESSERAFVAIMAMFADELTPRELHEQRVPFVLHGANFFFALVLAKKLRMDNSVGALTQSVASHAQRLRNFLEASRLFEALAGNARAGANTQHEASAYHQLGLIAEQQREFEIAREWYLKSLAILEKENLRGNAAATYHQLGTIAQEQREFETARKWYLKCLAIEEKQGNLLTADSYHGLGRIAQEQREFETARRWYLKSLAIKEKLEDPSSTAITYHQLGGIAQERREFESARVWYLKALAIKEKQGDLHRAASTYHQLGILAHEERKFQTAREWHLKALAIYEKEGDVFGTASAYHELGMTAQEQREFQTARQWYLKALAVNEEQGDWYRAALTYGQMGILEGLQGNGKCCAVWLARCIRKLLEAGDHYGAGNNARNFMLFHNQAPQEQKSEMERIWKEANLGKFPTQPNS